MAENKHFGVSLGVVTQNATTATNRCSSKMLLQLALGGVARSLLRNTAIVNCYAILRNTAIVNCYAIVAVIVAVLARLPVTHLHKRQGVTKVTPLHDYRGVTDVIHLHDYRGITNVIALHEWQSITIFGIHPGCTGTWHIPGHNTVENNARLYLAYRG